MTIGAKLEWYNPWGSVKDRIAYHMLMREKDRGTIGKGEQSVIEASSGNTGIALAAISNLFDFDVEIYLQREINEEVEKMLKLLGAKVHRVSKYYDTTKTETINFVRSTAVKQGHFLMDQYKNKCNLEAHYLTTGPEIWRQTRGRVSYFVAGIGTGGTISGVGRYLKEKNPEIKIIGVQPKDREIRGLRNLEDWTPEIYDPSIVDEIKKVTLTDALNTVRKLAEKESLLVGPSSGANAYASLQLAQEVNDGLIVTVFPDRIDKYLSTIH